MVKGVKESLAMYLERFGDTKVLAVCPENKAHEQTTIEGFNNGTKITEQAQAALVEMGRNPPQKRFELVEQFCSDCGIIHAITSFVCVSTSHYSEDHPGEVTFFRVVSA
mgnify:CR=1 FL=1